VHKQPSKFDDEQLAAIHAFRGAFRVDSCAGAGKTSTLVARIDFLRKQGVPESDILALTFTRSAAEDMRSRANAEKDTLRTLHSWALQAVKEEINEFQPRLRPFPLLINQFEIIIPLAKQAGVQYKDLTSYISNAKRQGKTPNAMFNEADNDEQEKMARAYEHYQAACRRNGVLDFDSIIWELVLLFERKPQVCARHQIPFLMIDEAQDCSQMDWRLIRLISQKYGNVWIVGDFAQCQPAGTMVAMEGGLWKPIEKVKVGEKVVSFNRHAPCFIGTRNQGRMIQETAARQYKGWLYTVSAGGRVTRCTPEHRWLVRFNNSLKYVVYLMKKGNHFRIGMAEGWYEGGFGPRARARAEEADAVWCLTAHNTRDEAWISEQVFAAKYGVPQLLFKSRSIIIQEKIDAAWRAVGDNTKQAKNCLAAFGRDVRFPLWEKATAKHGGISAVYSFITTACNLMPEAMSLCCFSGNKVPKWEPLSVSSSAFDGLVYSLSVADTSCPEDERLYVADGLLTHNSVYGFRGASPEIFAAFPTIFPGARTLPMGTNYRSQKNIVTYSQEVMPEQTSYLNNWRAHKPSTSQPMFIKFQNDVEEAKWVLNKVASNECMLNETAILARTNAQLAIMQGFCTEKGIAYKLLGKDNFWKRAEVVALLGLVKNVAGADDVALKQALHSPLPCVKFLRKDDAIDALEQLQAGTVNGDNGKPVPLKNLLRRVNTGDSRQNEILHELHRILEGAQRMQQPYALAEYLAKQTGAGNLGDDEEEGGNPENFIQDNIRKVVVMAGYFKTVADFVDFARKAAHPSRKQTRLILSTVHGFKGREAKNVFVIGVNLGVFPHDRAELQEEKRLFYVAVSRPTDNLFVSCSGSPSAFISNKVSDVGDYNELLDDEPFELHS
jgi:DNA helicase-2/ATP-dependent DNA helicase PcrA